MCSQFSTHVLIENLVNESLSVSLIVHIIDGGNTPFSKL